MKKLGKYAAIGAAFIVVLVVALAVLAKVLITPERVKEHVLPLAEKALHRQVTLGDVEVSLFSGITLKDLVVGEGEGVEPFVAADGVTLRYRLLPLLSMRVVVDEVRLDGPRIRVARNADGTFNFSDLLAPAGEGAEPEAKAKAKAEAEEPPGAKAPIDLLVSEVTIAGGELLFVDYAISAEAPYRYKLSGLDVNARNISLEKAFPFAVKAVLNESALSVDGEVDLSAQAGKVKLDLSGLDVTAFAPYFRDQVPGKLGSLKVDLDLSLEGDAKLLTSRGKIALKEIDLILDAMKEMPLRDTDLALDYDIRTDLVASSLEIADAKVALNGIPVSLSGVVKDFDADPVVDLSVALAELDLRSALASLPDRLVAPLAGMDPAGVIDARLELAGPVADPMALLKKGEVRLEGLQATAGGFRPALTGLLSLAGDTAAAEGLKLKVGDNEAAIDLKAANLFGKPIVVESRVTSERFDLDPLLKGAAAPASAPAAAPASAPAPAPAPKEEARRPADEVGPFDLPLSASGTVQVAKALYHGLAIDDFDMHYSLEKNVLTVDRMTGKVAGGSFSKSAVVDLGKKGLSYKTKIGLKGIQADPIVSAFAPEAAGSVFGALDLELEASGRGTLPEAVKRNISAKGDLLLSEGRLTGAGLVQGLADYLKLDELRDLHFSRAEGNFSVRDGKVLLDSAISGSKVRMSPKGSLGFDSSLDIDLNALLSPELTSKLDRRGKVSGYFKDDKGWGRLPLKVAGTLGAPRFTLDVSAVKEEAVEKAKKKVQEKLQEEILDKLGPKEGEEADPAKKILEDALKGLFGN